VLTIVIVLMAKTGRMHDRYERETVHQPALRDDIAEPKTDSTAPAYADTLRNAAASSDRTTTQRLPRA